MALLWSGPISESTWALARVAALVSIIPALGGGLGVAVLILGLLQPPLQYDLIMGNVTVLYVAAIIWFLRRPGWLGATPLALVIAVAAKPIVLPLLIVELRWRPRDVFRVGVVVGVAVAMSLPVLGVDTYVKYLETLLEWARAASGWTSGNVGPSRFGFGEPALVVGVGVLLVALSMDREERGVALALAATTLVQPAYGYYYAALLIPAAVELWRVDRAATFAASAAALVLALVSPALAGIAFIVAALPRSWLNRSWGPSVAADRRDHEEPAVDAPPQR